MKKPSSILLLIFFSYTQISFGQQPVKPNSAVIYNQIEKLNFLGSVLYIAAHPDDELLGCGGSVALHTKKGDQVTSIIVCEGDSLRYDDISEGHQNQIFEAEDIIPHQTQSLASSYMARSE